MSDDEYKYYSEYSQILFHLLIPPNRGEQNTELYKDAASNNMNLRSRIRMARRCLGGIQEKIDKMYIKEVLEYIAWTVKYLDVSMEKALKCAECVKKILPQYATQIDKCMAEFTKDNNEVVEMTERIYLLCDE